MMSVRLLIVSAILLVALILFSIYEQHREMTHDEHVACLTPQEGWFNRSPTWTGTPYFSPRCYRPSTPENQPETNKVRRPDSGTPRPAQSGWHIVQIAEGSAPDSDPALPDLGEGSAGDGVF
jgi:hypothetical protein